MEDIQISANTMSSIGTNIGYIQSNQCSSVTHANTVGDSHYNEGDSDVMHPSTSSLPDAIPITEHPVFKDVLNRDNYMVIVVSGRYY